MTSTPTALGTEVLVNTTTTNVQRLPVVAGLSNGGWVIAWMSDSQDGSGDGVYQQAYDVNGNAFGGETLVNSTTTDNQQVPSIAALGNGGWVTVWESFDQDGGGEGVYAQIYRDNGNTQGSETLINTFTLGNQREPHITSLANGGWAVAWEDSYDGDSYGVNTTAFDATHAVTYGETNVNTTTAGVQEDAAVAGLTGGGTVVAFTGPDASSTGIYFQRFDAAGTAAGSETNVNTTTANEQGRADVTALTDGGFVIVWESDVQDGSGYGVYQQRFNALGQEVGSETQVNTFTEGNQEDPKIAGLANGGWVVAWESYFQDGSFEGVFQQVYNADGTTLGSEMQVNQTWTTGDQRNVDVSGLADGGWLVTWEGQSTSVDYDIYYRRYDALDFLGTANADTLDGTDFTDTMYGLAGADTIRGKKGADILIGGAGADILNGNSGRDTADYSDSADAVTVDLRTGTGTGGDADGDTLTSIEILQGSAKRDTLLGYTGDDDLYGNNGADTLKGKSGDDYLEGGGGGDTLNGGGGEDEIRGGDGADRVLGRGNDDMLYGEDGDDVLKGHGGNDTLDGGADNDHIEGKGGNDTLTGGTGNDTFVFEKNRFGNDVILDFEDDIDTIELVDSLWGGGLTAAQVLATYATQNGLDVDFDFGTATLKVENTTVAVLENDLSFV